MNFEEKFDSFSKKIKNIGLSKDDFQEALEWGELYGRVLYTNYPDVYRDDEFEKTLIARYLESNKLPVLTLPDKGDLHIISEPYSTGGHTRLLEKILKVRGEGDVLVTRPLSSTEGLLKVLDATEIHHSEIGYDINGILGISNKYKTIFLHIHPDDLTTAVAMGVLKEKSNNRTVFINHADHIFSYGYYSSNVIAEMGPFGDKLRQAKNRGDATYLGLPFDFEGFKLIERRSLSGEITIMSGATSFKYKTVAGLSFVKLVSEILGAIPRAKLIIIGPNLTFEWLKVVLRYPKRIKVVPKLPYDEYKQLLERVDVYLDSFPLSGGTTVPEVRSKGIPVTGVMCGSYGYTPWDKTKYNSNAELVSALKELGEEGVSDIIRRNNDEVLIEECNKAHSFSKFEERLLNIASTGIGGEMKFDHEVNHSYFNLHWKMQKDLVLGKKSYMFLMKNWSAGGKDVMKLAISINPLKYGAKVIAGFLKLITR